MIIIKKVISIKKCSICILICFGLCFISGCNENTEKEPIIPLLSYDAGCESLQLCEWNVASNEISARPKEYFSMVDIAPHLHQFGWDGDNLIVLPYGMDSTEIQGMHEELSLQVEQHYDDVVTKNWFLTKTAENTLLAENADKGYQLEIPMLQAEYQCAGIVEKNKELALLMVNPVYGDTLLYCFDMENQKGDTYSIDGFENLTPSQLEVEKAAVEYGYGFYFTDGHKVYYVDAEKRTAEIVFSKIALVKSYADADKELSTTLHSCWITAIGAYQGEWIVQLHNDENHKYLCCPSSSTGQYVLHDYTDSDREYIAPNIEG